MQKTKTKTAIAVALVTFAIASGIVAAGVVIKNDGGKSFMSGAKKLLTGGGRGNTVSTSNSGGNNNNNNGNNNLEIAPPAAGEMPGTKDLPYHPVGYEAPGWPPADVEYYRIVAPKGTTRIAAMNDPVPSPFSTYETMVKKGSPISKDEFDAIKACIKKDGKNCNIYGVKVKTDRGGLFGPVYWSFYDVTLSEPLKEDTTFYMISVTHRLQDGAKHRMGFQVSASEDKGRSSKFLTPPHTCGNNICEWGEAGLSVNSGNPNPIFDACPSDCKVYEPVTKNVTCTADGYVFGGKITYQEYQAGYSSRSSIRQAKLLDRKVYIMKDGVTLCEGIGSQGASKDRGWPICSVGSYSARLQYNTDIDVEGDSVGPNNLYYRYAPSSGLFIEGRNNPDGSVFGAKVICTQDQLITGRGPVTNY